MLFAVEKKILFIYHYRHCPASTIPKQMEAEKRRKNFASWKKKEKEKKKRVCGHMAEQHRIPIQPIGIHRRTSIILVHRRITRKYNP